MTRFEVKPICAAIMLLTASSASALAQTATDNPPAATSVGASTATSPATSAGASAAGSTGAGADAPQTAQSVPATAQPAPEVPQTAPAVVQVTGLRGSLRSAEAIKRDSLQVVDAINAEDIGKFPDRQAGDALQRVAGVQVGRDRGQTSTVIIRGLPDVVTTIDGNEIFTAAARRLSYEDLPVQSIGGLEVYKSATPNQLEGGIAGGVNVRLRSPFD